MNTRPSLMRMLQSRHSQIQAATRLSLRRALRRRLGMELLEQRELLATITWTNPIGGDWGVAANWSPAQVPTANDDVIIPSQIGMQSITIASGNQGARSIQVDGDESLRINGGTLTVSGAGAVLAGTGSFEVAGGTLALTGNGWGNTSTLMLSSGTLTLRGSFTTDGLGTFTRNNGGTVRLEGALDNTGSTLNINSSTGSWQVVNGQITGGTIDYSDGEQLLFLSNENNRLTNVTLLDELQLIESSYVELYGATTFPSARLTSTIGGAGVWTHLAVAPGYVLPGNVFFAGVGTNNRLLGVDGIGTMTIPAGVTVETTPDFGGSAFVGWTNQTVINQGTIRSGTANRTLTIQPELQSSGTIRVDNGGNMILQGSWSNALGTLSVDNANLFMRGTFTTAGLGTFTRANGGTVRLEGALDNTGSTLNINSSTGSWQVVNGQITGGTIDYSDGEQLLFLSNENNRLTNVTLLDELQLIESSYVELYGATTFPSARLTSTIGGAGVWTHLAVAPGYVLPGNVFFAGVGTNNRLLGVDGIGTMTIPAGVTVETTPDFGGSAFVGSTNQTVINQGTIRSGTANRTLTIQPQTLQNSGTIQTENGGAMVINAITFANNVGGLVAATNATLTLAGNWSNAMGTLSSDNSNLFLRGTFTTAGLGTFTRTNGGTVRLEGALNNTGATLNINSSTGSWLVLNGQISGGTIDYSDGEQLRFLANDNNRLTDVTLLDELQLIESSYVELYGATTFPSARLIVTIGGAGVQPHLAVAPGYVLPGSVYFAGAGPNNRILNVDGAGTMTIPADVTLETTSEFGGSAFVGTTNQTVINQGTIRSGTANRTLTIQPQTLQNSGTIQAENGGALVINAITFANNVGGLVAATNATLTLAGNWSNAMGTLSSDNSNLFLRGTFTTAGLGTFTRTNGGTVRLEGALNNTGATLNINSSTGSWLVLNGQISGGTIDYSDGEQLRFLANDNNRLTDVTLLDELQLIESSYVELYGATTFPSARLIVTIGGAGVQPHLAVAPGYVLPGNVYFAGTGANNRLLYVDGAGTMTIPSGITVETSPEFGGSAFLGTTNQTVINQGTIRSGTANRTLTIQPQTLQNFGTIQAENSALMVVSSGAFANQGALTATGAAVLTVRPTVFSNFLDITTLGNNRFGITLQGGTYEVDGGTLRLFQGTNTAHSFVVRNLGAELILVGANPRVYGNTTNTNSAIAELAEIGAGGILRLQDGAFYGPPGELLVRGSVDVDGTSQFGLAPSAPITTVGLKSFFAAEGDYLNSAVGASAIVAQPVNGSTFATGVEGQGFFFDGVNDHVTIPADPSLNNTNLTVSAWYKLDQILTGPRLILSKTIGAGTLNSYAVWLDGDFIRFGIGDAGGLDFQSAAITRQVGQWNHVAMAFSDNSDLVQLFHNGSLLHSFSTTRSISYDNGRPHVIGADIENGNPAFFFPGVIDEVRHYDRALSASEIFNIAANSPGLTTRVRQVDGTVQIDGALASFRDYRLEGGTLFGSGTLPTNLEQSGGILAPGSSPGCMEIDGNYNLEAAGTLQIEIDGPTVCTQYDQLQVDGNVTLAGTLNVVLDPTYSPAIGQKFLILENDLADPISGQFLYDGTVLRERQVFLVNGNQLFRISYSGGDGNDAELEFLGKGALVSNTSDSGPGSLRQAVNDANASPGHDLIAFAIDEAQQVNGRYLIESFGLVVNDTTTINGTTQHDFAGHPIIEFRDQGIYSAIGLQFVLGAMLSEVRGLSFTQWSAGVLIEEINGVRVAGNYFGIPLDGSSGGGNSNGISIIEVDSQVHIGGTSSVDRNVIANSERHGIEVLWSSGVVIQGNYIGTDPTGMVARPNERGVMFRNYFAIPADNNLIGGTEPGEGNLISGNTVAGIEIDADGLLREGNQIVGNWIGVDATGNAALPNGIGVALTNSAGTSVSQNVISGNSTHGILITDGAGGNTISGNILGLNADGTTAVPNLNHGISIENGSANNIIGGVDAASRNIISGNDLFGVSVTSSNNNRILGNYLGLDSTGGAELSNAQGAILLDNSSFTSIGFSDGDFHGNRIVGADASQVGISLVNQSNSNTVSANRFGLSAADQPLGTLGNAISISESDQNTIGGTTATERNVLGQYSGHGVLITDGSVLNQVIGNYVGIGPDGATAIFTESHSTTGIGVINSPNNFIGSAVPGSGNLIGGNETGIFIGGIQSTSNEIFGNAIGLNASGDAAIGNERGIVIGDARNTRVGGVAVGQRNIISGNRIGIEIYGDNRDTTISGNWIGTNGSARPMHLRHLATSNRESCFKAGSVE
jgi:parallel beta-helix repeat protein